jgi:hypothetical protein
MNDFTQYDYECAVKATLVIAGILLIVGLMGIGLVILL